MDIPAAPEWLLDLIEEKAKDPANWGTDGRLCIAPDLYVRRELTAEERLLLFGEEGGAA